MFQRYKSGDLAPNRIVGDTRCRDTYNYRRPHSSLGDETPVNLTLQLPNFDTELPECPSRVN